MIKWICLLLLVPLSACSQGAFEKPPREESVISTESIGESLAFSTSVWLTEDATLNGHYHSLTPPPGVVSYGTWAKNGDKGVGEIMLELAVPEGVTHLALPIVCGPSVGSFGVVVADAASGEVLEHIIAPNCQQWGYMSIPTESKHRIRVRAYDFGTSWGQWIAIGTPRLIVSKPSS